MRIVDHHPIIEDALGVWGSALGDDRMRYRGHAYRVFNFARALLGTEQSDDALALASAFHDLGIWSDRTFDYLAPSVARASEYIAERRLDAPAMLVADAIQNHHVLFRIAGGRPDAAVVEAFRQADLVDVSAGLLRRGLPASQIREVVAAFPFAGFHGMLARTALRWLVRHPLRPLPMLRVARAPVRDAAPRR